MTGWLTKRKRLKQIQNLEALLVKALIPFHPDMGNTYKNAKLCEVYPVVSSQSFIQLQHEITKLHLDKNRKNYKNFSILSGVQIQRKNFTDYVEIPIEVTWDLISKIYIDKPNDFWKFYEVDTLKIVNFGKTEIPILNEDEENLRKILSSVEQNQFQKIVIEDTFEIELNGKIFYAIVDMEDGNYIVVNKKGQVFRLNHDSNEQIRIIGKSINNFLFEFSGRKEDLEKHFED